MEPFSPSSIKLFCFWLFFCCVLLACLLFLPFLLNLSFICVILFRSDLITSIPPLIKKRLQKVFNILQCYVNRPYPFQLWLAPRYRNFLARSKKIEKKVKRCFQIIQLHLNRPYPFQLWVAPRHGNFLCRWIAEKSEGGRYNIPSPPGFDEQLDGKQEGEKKKDKEKHEYALFLYPDNLFIYWIIFFLFTVLPGIFLGLFLPCEKHPYCSLAIATIFFIAAYHLIYFCFRRPILDDLLKDWPPTPNQKREFQNVPSKITFCSKEHCNEYRKVYPAVGPKKKNFFHWFAAIWQRDLFNNKSLSTSYFKRPVYYSPKRSLQEALLQTGIASSFAGNRQQKETSEYSLIYFAAYYFAHIWVSYLWLLFLLLYIFITGTRPDDSTMLHFVFPIICWAALTTLSLFVQFRFMNGPLIRYDRDLFLLASPRFEEIIKKNMRINQNTMKYLPKLLSIVSGATIAVYLALVTLIMQADAPSEKVLECKGTTSNYSLSFEIKKR